MTAWCRLVQDVRCPRPHWLPHWLPLCHETGRP